MRTFASSLFLLTIFMVIFMVFFSWPKTFSGGPPCPRCNVILIDIDILRADALPCYGYKRNTAPNICAFAQRGLTFNDNYSQGSWTLPSMFSTITSLYPSFHRVQKSYRDSLDPSIPTLAQQLGAAGYNTAYFGSIDPSVINDTNGGVKGYDDVRIADVKEWPGLIQRLARQQGPFFSHLYTPPSSPSLFIRKRITNFISFAAASGISCYSKRFFFLAWFVSV